MNETALITGASGGLGEEFARLCAARTMNVILVARSAEKLRALADELTHTHGIAARAIAADLSVPAEVDALARAINAESLPVTLLINNAGVGAYGPFASSDVEVQSGMVELNVHALTRLTRHLLPGMIARGQCRILNIASTAAFQPGPLMAVYYATKAYVLSFSLALSDELRGTGVTATCLCPGPTRTGFERRANLGRSKLFRRRTMDARTVATIGLNACLAGRPLVTAGILNKIGAFAVRFIPRMTAAALARRVQEEEKR